MDIKNFISACAATFACAVLGVGLAEVSATAAEPQQDMSQVKMEDIRAGAVKACASGKKFKIAFDHPVSEAAVVRRLRLLADQRAKALGCVTLLHDNTQANNLEAQINAVQSWITQGVDVIVVTPIDQRALKPLQAQAQKKGIKWLSYLGTMEGSDGFLGFDHVLSGQIVANAAVKWVKDNNVKNPKALVTTLTSLPSLSPRWTEVERIFAANGIEIVAKQDSADQTSGLTVTETVLKQHPDLNIIIGLNDDAAVGANRAVTTAGIPSKNMFIAGQDGSLEGLTAVNKGEAYKASAAILVRELANNIVDQSLNAVAKTGPTFFLTPTVLASKADQPLLDKLLKAYEN